MICKTVDDCKEIFVGNCDSCPLACDLKVDPNNPPAWACCQDPERCDDCGSLIDENYRCPICDVAVDPDTNGKIVDLIGWLAARTDDLSLANGADLTTGNPSYGWVVRVSMDGGASCIAAWQPTLLGALEFVQDHMIAWALLDEADRRAA